MYSIHNLLAYQYTCIEMYSIYTCTQKLEMLTMCYTRTVTVEGKIYRTTNSLILYSITLCTVLKQKSTVLYSLLQLSSYHTSLLNCDNISILLSLFSSFNTVPSKSVFELWQQVYYWFCSIKSYKYFHKTSPYTTLNKEAPNQVENCTQR